MHELRGRATAPPNDQTTENLLVAPSSSLLAQTTPLILTYDEAPNIARCLERLFAQEIEVAGLACHGCR